MRRATPARISAGGGPELKESEVSALQVIAPFGVSPLPEGSGSAKPAPFRRFLSDICIAIQSMGEFFAGEPGGKTTPLPPQHTKFSL